MRLFRSDDRLPNGAQALPGRSVRPFSVPGQHLVLETPLEPPFPEGSEQAGFAMGCFWGAEPLFWERDGVFTTAVGYTGGVTQNPTYEEVCTGQTGHAETVLVVYLPDQVEFEELLKIFWEGHDPTQGMRQGNDYGSQYRSALYLATKAQRAAANATQDEYADRLSGSGYGQITTEIRTQPEFFYAEDYHQQFLAKNPDGYCGLGGTGVSYPIRRSNDH